MASSSTSLKAVRKLRAAGDLVAAREALECMDLASDDMLALFHMIVLEELDESAAKQAAIIKLIDTLSRDRSDTILALLLRQSERVCLPMEMTEKVLAVAAERGSAHGELTLVCNAIRRRHAFTRRLGLEAQRAQLISIGGICLPWTLPNRWGFRNARQFVDDFNPFCLALHKLPGIIPPLRSDFRAYLNPKTVEVRAGKQITMFIRRNGSVQWRHNHGPYWTQNGFDRLSANLLVKIENFRRSCTVAGPIAFLMTGLSPTAEELGRLKTAVARATNRNDCLLILSNHDHDVEAHEPIWIDDTIIRFRCPFPTPEYRWHDLSAANSPAGLDFEEAFATMLLSCLSHIENRPG